MQHIMMSPAASATPIWTFGEEELDLLELWYRERRWTQVLQGMRFTARGRVLELWGRECAGCEVLW
jgi:hypothetical protein